MKKLASRLFMMVSLFAALPALMLAPSTAQAGSPSAKSDDIVHVLLHIRDADGEPVDESASPDTLLYESHGEAVFAPDGHQLTLGEFLTAKGSASVRCTADGTNTSLQLSGLIPKGVYTIWLIVFRSPGFDPTLPDPLVNVIGVGALGPNDGSSNVFIAEENGEATISATNPGGMLSARGSVGACWLTDEFEVHVVGAYHIDGATYGRVPGPEGTWVEHFGFMFFQQ